MTDCVDFEGKDKPSGFGFHSLLPNPEPAYPALALRKPSWVPGSGSWLGWVWMKVKGIEF